MPKVNVYLPEELATAVREAQISVSAVCQGALERAVRDLTAARASAVVPGREAPRGPFKGYTTRAYEAMLLAENAARELGSPAVDAEHILLGILDEGTNLAVKVLAALEVEPADIRAELQGPLSRSSATDPSDDKLPLAPSAKKVLEETRREANNLGHIYIGCEHLLLALLAVEDGLASGVLRRMGLELRTTRRAVTTALAGYGHARANPVEPGRTSDAVLKQILTRLEAIEGRLA